MIGWYGENMSAWAIDGVRNSERETDSNIVCIGGLDLLVKY